MLDVHPPHEAAHTWKDFFIHIATIVVGLLIAIGLEQLVEHIHQHHELTETRDALHQEREQNQKFFAINTTEFRMQTARLQNNLRVLTYLQQHPGTPEDKLPGVLLWSQTEELADDSVWKNAEQTQVLALMPRKEAESDTQLYNILKQADDTTILLYDAVQHAGNYALVDPNPSHLNPAQVDAVIADTKSALELDLRWGIWLAVLHNYYPEFSPAPSHAEIASASNHIRSASDQQKLAAATAITDAAMAPSRAANRAAMKAAGEDQ